MTTADQDRRAAEEIALLPCPFCGGKPRFWQNGDQSWVACRQCGGKSAALNHPDDAKNFWNRRALVLEQANRMIVVPIPKGTKTVTYAADRPSRIEVDLRKRAVLIYQHDRDEIGITPSPPESEG